MAIVFKVEIFDPEKQTKIEAMALWDTGATSSAISPLATKKLNIDPIGKVRVTGVHGAELADFVLIDVGLPSGTLVKNVNASICNLSGYDFIIGMNIILLGDFAICNGGGETLFSFATPSFEDKIDLCDKANVVNKRNKLQP